MTVLTLWRDTERCYRAVASRDSRFDGQFIMAVRTTGIYCRPSCPAQTPKSKNVSFYPTSAAAQAGGYRACRRCLPDAVPGSPEWNVRADLAARAMRLISDGLIEREGVPGLAKRLGYSERQLGRVLTSELGAGPLALARAHRAHAARLLIEMSELPLTDVAFAAGFASVRQFNDTIREVFATTPSELRTKRRSLVEGGTRLTLRLPYREPFDEGVFDFLADQAVPGVESGRYGRTLRLGHGTGIVRLRPENGHVRCELRLSDLRDLGSAVSRVRRLLDLDADPEAVRRVLVADPALAPLVERAPGIRVPGAIDGEELVLRAMLGSRVSATVEALGERMTEHDDDLTTLFPTAASVAEHGEGAVREVAEAMADGTVKVHIGRDQDKLRAELLTLPGIDPPTADYVVMRLLGAPDIAPSAWGLTGMGERAQAWRPWRSYAGMYLWRNATEKGTA